MSGRIWAGYFKDHGHSPTTTLEVLSLHIYLQNTLAGKSGSTFPSPRCESGVCWMLLFFFPNHKIFHCKLFFFPFFLLRQSFTLPLVTPAFRPRVPGFCSTKSLSGDMRSSGISDAVCSLGGRWREGKVSRQSERGESIPLSARRDVEWHRAGEGWGDRSGAERGGAALILCPSEIPSTEQNPC